MQERRILIIEDDPDIVKVIEMNISEFGARLEHASNGRDGLDMALAGGYSLIILDLMLPELGGIEVCKKIREQDSIVPVMMLTAKSEEIEKIVGLEVGADDYLTKPFSTRELVARIKALLRRLEVSRELVNEPKKVLSFPGLEIRPELHQVIREGVELSLTVTEFALLHFLAKNPGRPFTRDELARHVWESEASNFEGTINAQLSRLRKKLEKDPSEPKYIKTVWGLGYRFARFDELEN